MQLTLSTPALYSLELTPLCSNKCPGCFNVFIDDKVARPMRDLAAPLSAEQWHSILKKIQPYAERVKLTGGEPTLHPEFESIVHALASLNISFSIFTNARWRDPDRLIARLKATPQCTGLLISLHGADAATHEAYVGIPGAFDETTRNIRRAVQAGLSIATSTVITRQNFDKLDAVIKLSAALGAGHSVINRYLGAPLPGVEPTDAELQIAIRATETLRQTGARVKYGNCIPHCFVENSSAGCLAGVAYCAISPWGDLRPCNHSPTIVGNLLTQTVQEAWQSRAMRAWRALMPTECENACVRFATCHGGCRALIQMRADQRDPHRRAPIRSLPRAPAERITWYEGLHPIGRYHLRQEAFGYIVMRGNRIIPVSNSDYALLQMCDGQSTLRQIQNYFGEPGLRALARFYKKGIVQFAEHAAAPTLANADAMND